MKAMLFTGPGQPLTLTDTAPPRPGEDQILIRVGACAVCRTDLHVVDGELPDPKLPLILGHEIVGVVAEKGARVDRFAVGDRVGVPWLGWTCGVCSFCRSDRENLCDRARFTGGTVVCAGIHMSDIPSFPYADLWEERTIRSVANLTRRDAEEFLALAPQVPVETSTTPYPLARANEALEDLRSGRIEGAAVLVPSATR